MHRDNYHYINGYSRSYVSDTNSTAVCMDLSEFSNGLITYEIEETPRPIGTVATYECNPGFVLVGQENRTCVEDSGVGVFNGSEPVCDRKLLNT